MDIKLLEDVNGWSMVNTDPLLKLDIFLVMRARDQHDGCGLQPAGCGTCVRCLLACLAAAGKVPTSPNRVPSCESCRLNWELTNPTSRACSAILQNATQKGIAASGPMSSPDLPGASWLSASLRVGAICKAHL